MTMLTIWEKIEQQRKERDKERRKMRNVMIVSVTSMLICLALMFLLIKYDLLN